LEEKQTQTKIFRELPRKNEAIAMLWDQVRRIVAGIRLDVCALEGMSTETADSVARSIDEYVAACRKNAVLGVPSEAIAGEGANDPQQSAAFTLVEGSQQP
jgi:hypothetical protein